MNSMASRENVVIIKMTKHIDECPPEDRIHTYTHKKEDRQILHTCFEGEIFKMLPLSVLESLAVMIFTDIIHTML